MHNGDRRLHLSITLVESTLNIIQNPIPTNVITGFLGVGKTTTIQHLLSNKPASETWAILVNEFGEIGIDAALLNYGGASNDEIVIREVPGGCLCCAAGVPVEVALNQLISKAKPDRLLIEPTGLGHPKEILNILSGEKYRHILHLQATLTLVDARKLSDSRYTTHSTFNQQMEVADVVIANKFDLYTGDELLQLNRFLGEKGLEHLPVRSVSMGKIDLEWLHLPSSHRSTTRSSRIIQPSYPLDDSAPSYELPESGYLRKEKTDREYSSCGWVFDTQFIFDEKAIYRLLLDLPQKRIKAALATAQGNYAFNQTDGVLNQFPLEQLDESRIELIDTEASDWNEIESKLLQCLSPGNSN